MIKKSEQISVFNIYIIRTHRRKKLKILFYIHIYIYIKYTCGELYKQKEEEERLISFLTFVYNLMLIRSW